MPFSSDSFWPSATLLLHISGLTLPRVVAWNLTTQTLTWININLPFNLFRGINPRATEEMLKTLIGDMCSEIAILELLPLLLGTSALRYARVCVKINIMYVYEQFRIFLAYMVVFWTFSTC